MDEPEGEDAGSKELYLDQLGQIICKANELSDLIKEILCLSDNLGSKLELITLWLATNLNKSNRMQKTEVN